MKKETVNSCDAQSVLLAHPRPIREGFAAVIQGAGFRVIGQAEDKPNLRKLASLPKPDIILLDWEISGIRLDAVRRHVSSNQENSLGSGGSL